MDYAVIRTGGKQYVAKPGQVIQVELLEAEPGENVVLDDVLLTRVGDEVKVGQPRVEGAAVRAKVLGEIKGEKIVVFKQKRRKGYRNKTGHRQKYTRLQIEDIS